ncbi:MAG: phosphate acyltransferase PlsX [Acidimicrobiia bacterium]|nr:phosphate acyltransferase PlsX [Acidimicrobiia bacterium]MDH5236326.1 phosphate acyltransferase PlsX [Acidimicrobiia bacterium]
MLPIALDAMGGDHAPAAVVAGARQAVEEYGIPVLLVGRADEMGDTGGLEVIEASEVIAMDAEAGASVRKMKDSSLVRAAEAVRDGRASAMFSAGNTGATMASALLRMGRIKGVNRPAIATPIPTPEGNPTILLDAGANAECQADWLVQFAQMGAVYAKARYDVSTPRVGLLSIGEEDTKGNDLVKETHKLMTAVDWRAIGAEFVGNVEGRDVMSESLDVIVTDGFTGNVVLKTLEGGIKGIIAALLGAFGSTPEAAAAADVLLPTLEPLYRRFDAESVGSAMLLGVKGVCLIGHGSSSSAAIVNGLRQGADLVQSGLVDRLTVAVGSP